MFFQANGSSDVLDVLLHPRLPPLVRPLPPLENISLYRVEEGEAERELRAMLGLASPGDPEPVVFAEEPLRQPLEESQNPMQDVEPALPSHSVPSLTSQAPSQTDPPTQRSDDIQVDQPSIKPVVALPQDQTPTKNVPPASTPAATKFSEGIPPASEPPQLSSWNPTSFIGDEEEEEEEIPSINMDSDSD